MIATQGVDMVSVRAKPENDIEHLLAARSAVDHIAEHIETVVFPEMDDVFQHVPEGPGAAVDIGDDETTGIHVNSYSTGALACKP